MPRLFLRFTALALMPALTILVLCSHAIASESSMKDVLKDVKQALKTPTPPPTPRPTSVPGVTDLKRSIGEKSMPAPKRATKNQGAIETRPRTPRFSSKSNLVNTRALKKLRGSLTDTWFYGDFVASRTDGHILLVYPIWGGGFIRGYSTEVHVTFPKGVPQDVVQQLPQSPEYSTVAVSFPKNRPVYIQRVELGSGGKTVVAGTWYD
jgi:hypothetical protein